MTICNLTARCHLILHTGPLKPKIMHRTSQSSLFSTSLRLSRPGAQRSIELHIWVPSVQLGHFVHVSHPAIEPLIFLWGEGHVSGQVVVPVLLKGQVSLSAIGNLHTILQQLNFDFWRVEAAHMTDEGVFFPELSL